MPVVVAIVIVVVALAVVGVVLVKAGSLRSLKLRRRFGPEYDHAVEQHDDLKKAEQELMAREQRYAKLRIRPLDAASRDAYTKDWMKVQERFVDAPRAAVVEADHLVTRVMAARGYPADGFDQQARDLSVEHGRAVATYRTAHDVALRKDDTSTEDLRQAVVGYRKLFLELLGNGTSPRARGSAMARTTAEQVTRLWRRTGAGTRKTEVSR
jgi:hypothetical protein